MCARVRGAVLFILSSLKPPAMPPKRKPARDASPERSDKEVAVFEVIKGMDYEFDNTVALFTTRAAARACLHHVMEGDVSANGHKWEEEDPDQWRRGHEYCAIGETRLFHTFIAWKKYDDAQPVIMPDEPKEEPTTAPQS